MRRRSRVRCRRSRRRAVGKAAEANPAKEAELVGKAKARKGTLRDLRKECERVTAEAEADPDGAHRRRREGRHLRKRSCDDGSTEVIHHSTADETAEIWASCEAVAQRLFIEERRRGIRRPHGQRMADALVILLRIARGELDPRAAKQPTAADARSEDPAAEPSGEACEPANAGPRCRTCCGSPERGTFVGPTWCRDRPHRR